MATNMSVNSSANANSLLQQAAQSIINGSTGNGSMDVGLLVTTLVNAKTAGRAAALAASQQTGTTQISAFGALSSALGALETASPRWRMARCSRRSPRSRAARA